MPEQPTCVLWMRLDLRLADNPALLAAAQGDAPVVPVFIWAPEEESTWPAGGASRWWLHRSLASLDRDLRQRGSRLVIRKGASLETLRAVVRESGATTVHWNRRYEPHLISRDRDIKAALRADGLRVETHNSALLFEPWTIRNRAGNPFQVFTAFWNACLQAPPIERPGPAPDRIAPPRRWPRSDTIASLALEPRIDWAAGLRRAWEPGEEGAAQQLDRFLETALPGYADDRNRPDLPGCSRLSPHLHFGEIGPRQVWHAVNRHVDTDKRGGAVHGAETFLKELGWREFAHHLLFHFPHTPESPLRAEFGAFPWLQDNEALRAWQKGHTGFPIVDAGLRELWTSGWMHNRVRMIVASFLVKDLLLPWQQGARWFWDTLVDADLASNTLGWQWTAGCGADAAPYFRVFNPVTQGVKFDPHGEYVRRWVPELAKLANGWIHRPWEAPVDVLADAGVTLGQSYPEPIVDHAAARQRALAALGRIKRSAG